MKILLLSRYDSLGASSRLRCFQYFPYLLSRGIEVSSYPLLSNRYLEDFYSGRPTSWSSVAGAYFGRALRLASARKFDLVWIEKELFPLLPDWAERMLAAFAIPYAVDYDDALFHDYDLHRRLLVRKLLGRKIDGVMRHARLVVAGNEYLASRARSAGAPWVEILPTVVDLDRYPSASSSSNETFTIGWMGSPSGTRYVRAIAGPLAEVCRGGKARVRLIGSSPLELPGIPLSLRAWSEETERAEIAEFDVGLMPLGGSPWDKGKCGYKLIQYMACARPVVASDVGVNGEIVDEGKNGYLARTDGDWIRALNRLASDPELRARMGAEGRRKVEERYSLRITAPRLAELLRRCVENDPH